MRLAALRDRLTQRLTGLGQHEPASAQEAPEPPANPSRRVERAEDEREPTPRRVPEVPKAIAFDLAHGLGWPRQLPPGGLAQPGRGPLVVRPQRLRD